MSSVSFRSQSTPSHSTRNRSRRPSGDHLHSADWSLFSRNCLSGFAALNAAASASRFCRRRSFSRFRSATPGSWSASQYRSSSASPISTRRSGGACRVAFQSLSVTSRSMVTNSCRAWARSWALSSYPARSGSTNGVFCVFGLPWIEAATCSSASSRRDSKAVSTSAVTPRKSANSSPLPALGLGNCPQAA